MSLGLKLHKVNIRYLGFAAAGIVLVAGAIGGYHWYRLNKEQKAQEAFSSCMREYERSERDASLWPNTELVFRLALEQNQNTSMTPTLLAYQAEALLHMNKPEQALACMGSAVDQLPKNSDIYHLYATKYALMMMDAADETLKEKGLALLTTLAHEKTNMTRDMALYYLGLYYWTRDDAQQARATWSELVPMAEKEPVSPWAERAMQKIEQL